MVKKMQEVLELFFPIESTRICISTSIPNVNICRDPNFSMVHQRQKEEKEESQSLKPSPFRLKIQSR